MPGQQEKQEILRRLRCDTETEMSRDDLERMLEEEMAKPEEQLDTALVGEIVMLLEQGASAQEQAAAWRATAEQLPPSRADGQPEKRTSPAVKWVLRFAAVLLVAFVMMAATYKTAEAFNWQLVLRLMRPVAETFMLYTGRQPEATLPPADEPAMPEEPYDDGGKTTQAQEFMALADAPDHLQGYPVKPYGVPERFVYLQGSVYSDDLNTSVTHVFAGAAGMCIFTATILNDADMMSAQLYERTDEEPQERYIAGCRVVFYFNSDDATMAASWVRESTQYGIFGAITEEELTAIVESTMSR